MYKRSGVLFPIPLHFFYLYNHASVLGSIPCLGRHLIFLGNIQVILSFSGFYLLCEIRLWAASFIDRGRDAGENYFLSQNRGVASGLQKGVWRKCTVYVYLFLFLATFSYLAISYLGWGGRWRGGRGCQGGGYK